MLTRLRHLFGDSAKILAYRCGLFPSERQITSPLKRLELAEAMAVLEIMPNDLVLDLCCGSGLPGQIIAKRAGRVIGLDLDPQQVADAGWHKRHSRVRPRVDLVRANAERLPLGDGTVDACFSLCTIEHLLNADRACREVYRVLKPGGVFVLTADSLGTVPASFPLSRHATMYSVHNYYTTGSLSSLLKRNGFVINCCRPILRSPLAANVLLASMDAHRRNGVVTSARIRMRLEVAEKAASGSKGLFVLAAARKDR